MYNWFLKYLLDNDPKKTVRRTGIWFRRHIANPLIRRLGPLTIPYKLVIDSRADMPTNRPIIFAATHGFKDDVLGTTVTVDRPVYYLDGSLPLTFHQFEGVLVWLNGVVLVDRTDRDSRKAARAKMKRVLDLGMNIGYFPEGIWNISENLLMLKLFPGVYNVAAEAGAHVAPVATLLSDGTIYAKLGAAFDMSAYSRDEGVRELRDRMATLKWELMAKYAVTTREKLLGGRDPQAYWADYVAMLEAEVAYYDREMELKAGFRDKNEYCAAEVFAHLDAIEPRTNTAFLFNPRASVG